MAHTIKTNILIFNALKVYLPPLCLSGLWILLEIIHKIVRKINDLTIVWLLITNDEIIPYFI